MDNILIANEIAQHTYKQSSEGDKIENNETTKNKIGPSKHNYKSFLQYMETLRPNKKNYDIQLEIQKYHIWSKNANSTYHCF